MAVGFVSTFEIGDIFYELRHVRNLKASQSADSHIFFSNNHCFFGCNEDKTHMQYILAADHMLSQKYGRRTASFNA